MVHVLVASMLLGMMIFFSAVVTPVAFKNLDQDSLKVFLRSVFPRLFNTGIIFSSIMTFCLMWQGSMTLLLIGLLITVGFIVNRFWLTGQINLYRDRMETGDTGAETGFKVTHGLSVAIYLFQIFLLVTVLVVDPKFYFF